MKRQLLFWILCLVAVGPVSAQALTAPVTVTVYYDTALLPPGSDLPNPVMAPVSYAASVITCGQPKEDESSPLVNPDVVLFDDPADATFDCRIDVAGQMRALPETWAVPYRARLTINANEGPLTNAFSVRLQSGVHPCDLAPASALTVTIWEPFTLGWCHDMTDENGNVSSITGWRLYRNGVLVSPDPVVTSSATANADGLRYFSVSRAELQAGQVTFTVAAVSAEGESAQMSPAIVVDVLKPKTKPRPPVRGRATIP